MLGARMHFAVPSVLADAGLLHTLYTDAYLGNKVWLRKLLQLVPGNLKPKALRQLSGRVAEGIPANRVVSFDRLGLSYFLNRRRTDTAAALSELFAKTNHQFGNSVVQAGLGATKFIWGFNGAALEIFQHAHERGIKCILEQTIAPRNVELEFMQKEMRRWPDWQADLLPAADDPLARREIAEWVLADKIICGSEFVADALKDAGVDGEKLAIVPYGIDVKRFQKEARKPDGKFKVLFVGEVGLRKGVPYLLEALRSLNRPETIHAKLVGPIAVDRAQLKTFGEWCEFVGPVSRADIHDFYRWADVLVLPSVCEGSATVTYEALAYGLPIITTANSGSVVRNGVDGFIVTVCSSAELASHIALLCDDERLRLRMSGAASERTAEISLEAYASRLLKVLSMIGQ